jgi:hypothetical protein
MVQTGVLTIDDLAALVSDGAAAAVSMGLLAKAGVLAVLLLLGLFLWPMTVLCFALGGVSCLGRLDLLVVTIAKTLPVYLLTVLLVNGVDLIVTFFTPDGPFSGPTFLHRVVQVYADIFAMRVIGLYYAHFKRRFAWSWE